MKRAASVAVLLASLCGGQTGAVIEGMVTNSVTHAAVSGASVSLTTKGEQYEATTDSAGAYRIEGLKPGQYTARFSNVGFRSLIRRARTEIERDLLDYYIFEIDRNRSPR